MQEEKVANHKGIMADENENEKKDEVAKIAPFDPTKKTKKKKVTIMDTANDSADKLAEKTESLSVQLVYKERKIKNH